MHTVRSYFIYVLDELCVLSSDSMYWLLDQFCSYHFSRLKWQPTNEIILAFSSFIGPHFCIIHITNLCFFKCPFIPLLQQQLGKW